MKTVKVVLKDVAGTIQATFAAWQADKASRLAAALAYYAIFSLAPLLIIVIAMVGLIFGERAAQNQIAAQIADIVGADSAALIQTMIANVSRSASGSITATLIGTGTMLLGASGFFGQLQDALNTIWHVHPPPKLGIFAVIKQRLILFAMVFGMGGLLILSFLSNVAVMALSRYFEIGNLLQTINFSLSFFIVTLLFAVIYKVLPDANIAWKDVTIGALVTSLLFALGKWGISLYMGSRNIGSTFGAAGSLTMLLVWIYYSAQIFLLGAEFTQAYAHRFGSQITPTTTLEEPPDKSS